jgi:hypothetical protein
VKRPPPRRSDRVEELLGRLALDDADGPALPLDDERALSLVRQARERLAPVPRGRLLRFPKLPLIGVGVVVATSAAAAALGGFPRLAAWVSDIAATSEMRELDAPSTRRQSAERAIKPESAPLEHPSPVVDAPSAASAAEGVSPERTAPAVATPALELPSEAPDVNEPPEATEPAVRLEHSARAQRAARAELAMPHRSSARAPLAEPDEPARATPDEGEPNPPRPPARAAAARSRVSEGRSHGTLAPELALDPVASPDSAPAADLLGVANRARAERRFDAAIDAYRRVIEHFPNTRQAQIARVSAGDLELERGDPRAAELLFYGAVRDADVGAEALFGLAEAYRGEARVVEERRALVLFGQRHPSNPLAPAVRRRLSEIGEAHAPR